MLRETLHKEIEKECVILDLWASPVYLLKIRLLSLAIGVKLIFLRLIYDQELPINSCLFFSPCFPWVMHKLKSKCGHTPKGFKILQNWNWPYCHWNNKFFVMTILEIGEKISPISFGKKVKKISFREFLSVLQHWSRKWRELEGRAEEVTFQRKIALNSLSEWRWNWSCP